MTIRFAMAQGRRRYRCASSKLKNLCRGAANDNHANCEHPAVLTTALRYFARHGLSVAEAARAEAILALTKEDEPAFRKWLEICRTFDRRMAAGLLRRHTRGTSAKA